ncbi:uncharacterized protein NPIL_576221 [Nephila pilipes]|uniref:Uncharacterized protein n=1 Tax=Nephila pilipes TaxID=299642 RepID=A0A8X6NFW8_NEPPI|nr:uncharacterized protein NPIL_576221 [Nephila pilipes]
MSEEPAELDENEMKLKTSSPQKLALTWEQCLSLRQSKCCLSPIPITIDGDQTEDYFYDCITQDEFAKCLDLVSKAKLQAESRDSLLAEYPLRLLSRSKAYRTLEDIPSEDLRDLKLPDDMPLTSLLGMKILHLNESRNFFNEETMMISLKRYDSFCRIPFNATKPGSCHFPKLRCREKSYPVSTLLKSSKHKANHFYTYGRRQRLDRVLTLKTGLNGRSRKLQHLCERKNCFVNLTRLTKEEIESWRNKPSQSVPASSLLNQIQMLMPMSRFSSVPIATSITLAEGVFLFPPWRSILKIQQPKVYTFSELTEEQKKKCRRKCSVTLTDVTELICKQGDDYYIRNTSICIPFYRDFLSLLKNRKSLIDVKETNGNTSGWNNDHVYHKSNSSFTLAEISKTNKSTLKSLKKMSMIQAKTSKIRSVQKIEHGAAIRKNESKSSRRLTKLLHSKSRKSTKKSTDQKEIAIIDLTEETNTEVCKESVPTMTERFTVSKWRFKCFGCGYKCLYPSSNYKFQTVEIEIQEHMKITHSIMDPESFLSRYLDRTNRCTVIEAFPSSKGKFHSESES